MQTFNPRFLGGILLVAGTTIGAGMLALPVVTSFGGFFPSLLIFTVCWLLMLATSFFFLDVNLAIRGESNLVSMAGKTLGWSGKAICWTFYLLLLYSLLSAYIAASAPLFERAVLSLTGRVLSPKLSLFCLPLAFGSFIYFGTKGVDRLNRILMLGLALSYILLVVFVPSHIQWPMLAHVDMSASLLAIPVVMTSFGYHIIIPSLTTYLQHDRKLLRKALLWGSVLPFGIYLVWQVLILGAVPQGFLSQAWIQGQPATEALSRLLQNPFIAMGSRFFSFFAIITSFLGVALSLSDFLTDGLKIKKTGEGRILAFCLTFVPPLIFVFSYQRVFYLALEYAGVFVAILLGVLPAAMAWKLKENPFYRSVKGKLALVCVIVLCLSIVLLDLLEKQGVLHQFISSYLSFEK